MASIVGDEPCPSCREQGNDKTGNHLIKFDDGNKYCNRCHYFESSNNGTKELTRERGEQSMMTVEQVLELPIFGIPHRNISLEACEHYGVRTEFDGQGEPTAWYYPHTTDGRLDGFKRKDKDKKIVSIGNTKGGDLFGQSSAKSGGSFVVVTEGEEDSLAVWDTLRERSELEDWRPACVSLYHGASSAVRDCSNNLEYLQGFKRTILCFDQDDAGVAGVASVGPLLGVQGYHTHLSEKDACDMVMQGKGDELKWDILKHAKRYQPDGIINGADTWDRYKHSSTLECHPYPYESMNELTYGYRPGSVITVTSGTGIGKTQFVRELKYDVFRTTDWPIADIALEEDVGDTVAGLMSLHMGRRLHLPDVVVSEDAERQAHEELFGSRRFSFYDHFGGMDDSSLFAKLRYYGATGHRVIFLDHLSIIVSEYAAEGGERERIDTIMTKLAKLAKELELVIFIVVHLRKESSGRSFEQGATPSLDDLRGSGSLKQLSWDVISLSRNQQHHDPICRNTTLITVLKCRFTGRTGPAGYLRFSEDTGRMESVAEPEGYYETVKREW